jgi:hypothetical protein
MSKRPAIAAMAALVGAYLIGAFIAWDWNPGHWDAAGRMALGVMAPLWAAWAGVCSVMRA